MTIDVAAQYPGSSRNPTGGRNPSSGFGGGSRPSQRDPSRDTLSKDVYYYYAENAAEKMLFQDSSFLNFHLYDPIRQSEYEYANLGNLGSAHRQLVYQQRFHKGFDAGFHHYDLYLTQPADIRYYQLEKAYSDITFSQTSQEKTAFNGDFSKPIGRQMFLNIRYRNIRNEGQYINQAARTNSFAPSVSYQSKNGKYRGYLSVIANTVEQKENLGLSFDAATFSNVRKGLVAVGRPVNSTTGESRYFNRDLNYTQFYILEKIPQSNIPKADTKGDSLRNVVTKLPPKQVDSTNIDEVGPAMNETRKNLPNLGEDRIINNPPTNQKPLPRNQDYSDESEQPATPHIKPSGRKFTLKHNLSLRKNTYKFVDTDTAAYSSNFITDNRGVRSFIENNQVKNTFSIRTFKLEKTKGSLFTSAKTENPSQKDLIEVGLTHTYTKLRQEGAADSTINNLFLFGKIQFTPSKKLKINAYGHLGAGKQVGDYYLKGDFLWDTKKLGKIDLNFTNQRYTPSLINQRFLVTNQPVWVNNFKKPIETTFSAKYAIPKFKIDLTANYHVLDNYIYSDTLARPTQKSGIFNILQLAVKNQIDVGRFHLQNTVYFQTTDADEIRFPEIYSIHRLYVDLKLFKVMESQFGAEVRLNTPWQPDNFNPLTGQFYLQDSFQSSELNEERTAFVATPIREIPFYPVADVFYNFRIKDFRFFLVVENLFHLVPAYRNFHYTTYPYPIADMQARFGFRWLFLD